jgi:hypothetical protein
MDIKHSSDKIETKRSFGRRLVAWTAMAALGALLSGCVVYGGPGYYHPHRAYYYY